MTDPGLAAKIEFLRRPETHADADEPVQVVETHMSWVFLTPGFVYKLKKPVRFDSLDFSTLALRRRDCEEELRLNRRLAADVYLGIVALRVDADGRLRLGACTGPGEVVDWLVHMRRLPAEQMLDARLARGPVRDVDLRPVALHLARFYARAAAEPIAPEVHRARLAEGTRADRAALGEPRFGLPAARVEALAAGQLAFLTEHAALLEARVRDGRIVEGHGDLRPEHICLGPQPAIIDCLEFSHTLRILDPADELAFLALECERLGQPAVGERFLSVYAETTGDHPPSPLLRFYRRYRALRRAKIAVWHLDDPQVRDPAKWRDRARAYLDLAEAAPPR